MLAADALPPRFQQWFADRGWSPREHQLAMLEKARAGRGALLIAPTGGGKTLAGFLPSLIELAERPPRNTPAGVHTLYISPLKALAVDVERNLLIPVREMGLSIGVESRSDFEAAKVQLAHALTYARYMPAKDRADLHVQRDRIALVVFLARADGQHFALIRLFSGGVRNDDARSGLGFVVQALHDHAVVQRTQVHTQLLNAK